jgi:hypothetical protein
MAPAIQLSDATYRALLARVSSFEDTAEDVIRQLLNTTGAQASSDSSDSPLRSSRRASPGSILPEREYWLPLLAILQSAGGSMGANDAIEEVGRRLHDRFSERDFEELGLGEVRWRNRTRFARLRMKERGLLDERAPRGIWAITAAGRDFLARSGTQTRIAGT